MNISIDSDDFWTEGARAMGALRSERDALRARVDLLTKERDDAARSTLAYRDIVVMVAGHVGQSMMPVEFLPALKADIDRALRGHEGAYGALYRIMTSHVSDKTRRSVDTMERAITKSLAEARAQRESPPTECPSCAEHRAVNIECHDLLDGVDPDGAGRSLTDRIRALVGRVAKDSARIQADRESGAAAAGDGARDEIERLTSELDAAKHDLDDAVANGARIAAERDEARAEIERLEQERDAACLTITLAWEAIGPSLADDARSLAERIRSLLAQNTEACGYVLDGRRAHASAQRENAALRGHVEAIESHVERLAYERDEVREALGVDPTASDPSLPCVARALVDKLGETETALDKTRKIAQEGNRRRDEEIDRLNTRSREEGLRLDKLEGAIAWLGVRRAGIGFYRDDQVGVAVPPHTSAQEARSGRPWADTLLAAVAKARAAVAKARGDQTSGPDRSPLPSSESDTAPRRPGSPEEPAPLGVSPLRGIIEMSYADRARAAEAGLEQRMSASNDEPIAPIVSPDDEDDAPT